MQPGRLRYKASRIFVVCFVVRASRLHGNAANPAVRAGRPHHNTGLDALWCGCLACTSVTTHRMQPGRLRYKGWPRPTSRHL